VSSRIGMAIALAYLWRRKREADPPHAVYLGDLPAPPRSFGDAHRETDAPDPIDDEADEDPAPEVAPEPETVAEPVRRHRCGYPAGSVGCRNTCGDGAS
jgi:hypothetical protein